MEGQTLEFNQTNEQAYNSILAINQTYDNDNHFDCATENDLFDAPITYVFLPTNIYSDFDSSEEDSSSEDSSFNLGPSEFTTFTTTTKTYPDDQIQIFRERNILRPRGACRANAEAWSNAKTTISLPSENRWNPQGMTYNMQDYNYSSLHGHPGHWHREQQSQLQSIISKRKPENLLCGDSVGVDDNFVCFKPAWNNQLNQSALKVEGKAVNTADGFLVNAGLQDGVATTRNDHLDGPVHSSFNSEEAEICQYNDEENASCEFESDGNSYTSLTDDSME